MDIAAPFVYGFGAIDLTMNVKVLSAIAPATEEFYVLAGLITELDYTPGEGAYFRYDATSANWLCVTNKSGIETVTDSGIAVTPGSGDTFQTLRIVSNTTATAIQFYVNGALGCTNTTNLPVGTNGFGDQIAMHIQWEIQKTVGTTECAIYADFANLTQTLVRQ